MKSKTKLTTTKKKTASRETPEERFASVFRRASQLAQDHVTERALNIHELIDSTGIQFDDLVNAIDPSLKKRGLKIEDRLRGAMAIEKWPIVEEYDQHIIEETDAEREAAFLVGVAVGMRLAGGAR